MISTIACLMVGMLIGVPGLNGWSNGSHGSLGRTGTTKRTTGLSRRHAFIATWRASAISIGESLSSIVLPSMLLQPARPSTTAKIKTAVPV